MYSYFLSALLCGIRAKSFQAAFVVGLVSILFAYLAGAFSPRQPQTVVVDVGMTGIRFSAALLVLFWVQELVTKEIERKTVYFSLAYPTSRSSYVLGRYLAILALSAIAVALMGASLWSVVLLKGALGGYAQQFAPLLGLPYWAAMFGIWLDAAVVAAFTLWVATLSTVSMMPIACGLAFVLAGRSLGAVIDFIRRGADGDTMLAERFGPVIDWLQWVLPDLSRLDWRAWSLYGQFPGEIMGWSIIAALGCGGFFVCLATIQFSRREFL